MRLIGLMSLIITIHDAPRDFPQESFMSRCDALKQ
jgi:hypothetical protein